MGTTLTIPAGDTGFSGYSALPQGSGKHPALIVIEEVWGLTDHIKDVCHRFAAEGFVVLAPELIDPAILAQLSPDIVQEMWSDDPDIKHAAQANMRELMQPIWSPEFAQGAIAKLKACVDYVLADESVDGNVGTVGFCFGGTYAFQLAIHDARIKASVPLYGQPPQPLESIASIQCPILNFNGGKDERLMAQIPALTEAMKEYGKEYTAITYPEAGHAFFNDTNKRAYDAAAAQDAWQKMLAFLHEHLV
jgi:carboxymethylenebutenolidase